MTFPRALTAGFAAVLVSVSFALAQTAPAPLPPLGAPAPVAFGNTTLPPPAAGPNDNCTELRGLSIATDKDMMAFTLPLKSDKTTYSGPVHVIVWAAQDRALVGGSVTRTRWCKNNRSSSHELAIFYDVDVVGGVINLAVKRGSGFNIRFIVAGNKFDTYVGADTVQMAIRN